MILALELAGSFLGGAGFALLALGLGGRWYLRRKLGPLAAMFEAIDST